MRGMVCVTARSRTGWHASGEGAEQSEGKALVSLAASLAAHSSASSRTCVKVMVRYM